MALCFVFSVCFSISAIGNSGIDSVSGVSSSIVIRDTSALLFILKDTSSPETCDVTSSFKNFRFQNVYPDGGKFMDVKTYTPLLLRGDKTRGVLIFVEYARNGVYEGTMTYMSLRYEKNAETLSVKIDTVKSQYQSRFGPNFKASWISFVSSSSNGIVFVLDYYSHISLGAVAYYFSGENNKPLMFLGDINHWLAGDSLSGLNYQGVVGAQSYSNDSVAVKVSYGSDSVVTSFFKLSDNTGITVRANKSPSTKMFYPAPSVSYDVLGRKIANVNRSAIGLNIIQMNGVTVRKTNFNRFR